MINKWLCCAAIGGLFLLGTASTVLADQAATTPHAGASLYPSTVHPNDPIATVNGISIPVSSVEAMAMRDPDTVNPIIEKLADDCLIDQEAKRQNAEATPDEIEGRKEQLMALNKVASLNNLLNIHHETMSDLEHDLRVWIETVKLLTPNAKPPEIMQIRFILVRVAPSGQAPSPSSVSRSDAEALVIIQNIKAKINEGANFDALAKDVSEDAMAKETGGDLGFVYDGSPFDPGALAAALTLKKPGETIAAPVRTSDGYCLIQLVTTADLHPASQNAAYANIAVSIRSRSVTSAQIQSLVTDLRKTAEVVNHYAGQ